jgi:plastocyanin
VKTFFLLLFAIALLPGAAAATTHTITNTNFTFSPSTLTIQEGDTVVFSLAGIHDALEVSLTTWTASGITPLPGGFSTPFGGGTVSGLTAGTHYYVCQNHVGLGMKGQIIVNAATAVGDDGGLAPRGFALNQNYPNPFNPATEISFSLGGIAFTEIAVYDALGRLVKTLVAETLPAGEHSTRWDGLDGNGNAAVSGAYFVKMRAGANGGDYSGTMKILLVR